MGADDVERGQAPSPSSLARAHEDGLRWVADGARRSVPGCVAAAITVVEEDEPVLVVATNRLAGELDRLQWAAGEGPVLDSLRQFQVFSVEHLADAPAWPEFARVAVERGVMSSLTGPITMRGRAVGALTLYSRHPEGLSGHEQVVLAFAARAARTLGENRPARGRSSTGRYPSLSRRPALLRWFDTGSTAAFGGSSFL